MSEKKPMRSRPPAATLDKFIEEGVPSGTEVKEEEPSRRGPYPWEEPSVRSDVHKVYNVRLPEPYLLKLRYISEHTPKSMQQFCLDVLLPAIDEKINEIV